MLISLPSMAFLGHSAHEVYDVLPVRCQTYGYLPSHRALPHGREAFPVPLMVGGWVILSGWFHTKTVYQTITLISTNHHHHHTTILRPFFRDYPGEPVPEENFWTLCCKGRLTEADTRTIRLGATPSGQTSAHLHHPPYFYGPDALPAAQPTVSKHWRQLAQMD